MEKFPLPFYFYRMTRFLLALLIGFYCISANAQAPTDSCNKDQILLQIGGLEYFKANQPKNLNQLYMAYSDCITEASPKEDVRFLIALGVAKMNQAKQVDSTLLSYLTQLAEKAADNYSLGVLKYQAVKLATRDRSNRYNEYVDAAALINRSDSAESMVLGVLYWNLVKYVVKYNQPGDFEKYLEKSIQISRKRDEHYQVVDRYCKLGQIASYDLRDSALAYGYLEKAEKYCAEHAPIHMPHVMNSIGIAHHFFNRPKALSAYTEAAELCIGQIQKERQCPDCGYVLRNVVSETLSVQDFEKAGRYLTHQASYLDANSVSACLYFLSQSQYQYSVGNCNASLTYARWANDCYASIYGKNHPNMLYIFDAQLQAYDCIGDLEAAEQLVSEADKVYTATGELETLKKTYANLAITYTNNGAYEKGFQLFNSDQIAKDDSHIGQMNKALTYGKLGLYEQSDSIYRAVLTDDRTSEDKAFILANMAISALRSEQYDSATAFVDAGLLALATLTTPKEGSTESSQYKRFNPHLGQLLLTKANIELALFRSTGENIHLDQARLFADRTEQQLEFMSNSGVRSPSLGKKYTELIGLRLSIMKEQGIESSEATAFLVKAMEANRSRGLLRALMNNEYSRNQGRQEIDSISKSLNSRLKAYEQGQMDEVDDEELREEIAEEMAVLYEVERLVIAEAGFIQSQSEEQLNIEVLQQWAHEANTSILSYLVQDETLYVLHLSANESHVISRAISRHQLDSTVNLIVNQISTKMSPDRSGIDSLSRWLIPESIAEMNEKGLVILPDGSLNRLPFELLNSGEENLVDKFNLAYSFSLSQNLDGTSVHSNSEILAIAPAFNSTISESVEISRSKWLFARSAEVISMCSPLPNNGKEAEAATRVFSGDALLGSNATEQQFTDALKDQAIVLLSMHGFNYDQDPMLSGLVFSNAFGELPQDTATSFHPEFFQNDGILHAFEIYDMNLDNELVILSACHSGSGVYKRGEGAMSLARAFMAAGAKSVVMSLWQADDESTLAIISDFLENLKTGMKKSEALSEAKRKFRSENPTAPEYYWAGLVLVGSDAPIPAEKNIWLWFGLITTTLIIVGARYKRRSMAA